MPTWKKVIVSGSQAELATLKVDNLTSGSVVIGGGSVGNLSTIAINGSGSIVATTNATGLVHSGSFSGSFSGLLITTLPAISQPNFVAYNVSTGQFSYAGTGSFTAATASYVTSSNVDGPFGRNSILTASYAVFATSASYAINSGNAQSASFATNAGSASYALNAGNAQSASFATNAGSASYALNAGNAQSASFATNANSASYALNAGNAQTASFATNAGAAVTALTASSADNFLVRSSITATGSFNISGSITSTGTITAQTLVVQTITSSVDFVTGSTRFGTLASNTHVFTGSVSISGSLTVQGAVSASSFTGSLLGNVTSASFATTAVSSSYSLTATSASYAVNAGNAISASFSTNAVSSSYALNAGNAISASFSTNAGSASYALNAGNAISASFATNAGSASYALNAGNAQSASFATNAANAATASFVTSSNVVGPNGPNTILSSSFALTASFAQNGGTLTNALTFGVGLSGSAASFNGAAAVTVAISGSNTLSSNVVPKWTGTGLTNTNITDTGTQVQIGAGASSGVSVAAGGINVTGNSTFNNNVTIAGDLAVNGTTTFINTTNTFIKDQFVLINSGSNTLSDGGIIVQYSTGSGAGPVGSAIFLESAAAGTFGRWAVAYGVTGSQTTVAADEYIVSTIISASSALPTAPTWGGSTNGLGNMFINSVNGDIFIYS